ncbi:hypothetical protein HYPSUDRAFT_69662 [Hypholoma sublateritium FD-334 SS-4]|uniref:Uncharacterized protein n=1 Tax=Hypholoma sublateritium (strain FD-334 SS-4) TaxID=945553 RepID=A0A0D2KVT3_HYPSF|nr:hypothetical protein HYPSUDRAFT_69662 [Hypholoma sublateritium FD-334 SS-4]
MRAPTPIPEIKREASFKTLLKEAWANSNSMSALEDRLMAVINGMSMPLSEDDRLVVESYIAAITRALGIDMARRLKATIRQPVKHCVRCHAPYSEDDFGTPSTPCVVPHAMCSRSSEKRHGGSERYRAVCCGYRATIVEEALGTGRFVDVELLTNCFEGRHTTDVRAVESYGPGGPRAGYNCANVHPCSVVQGRCVRACVQGRLNKLVWDWEFEPKYAWMAHHPPLGYGGAVDNIPPLTATRSDTIYQWIAVPTDSLRS